MTEDELARACAHIQSALDIRARRRGGAATHRLEHVLEGVRDGRYQLWAGSACTIVTEILAYPLGRDLNYWLAGGDVEEMKALEPGIEAWARAAGCRRVTTLGVRRAGGKILKARGWRHLADVMEKEL